MIHKLEEYLRIAEIHKKDPELRASDGEYIIKKLKIIQKDILQMMKIFGANKIDKENYNKINEALDFYANN